MAVEVNNGGVTTIGLGALVRKFERLKTSDPELARMLTAEIKKMLREVRNELSRDAQTGLQMNSDPRQAYRAIRHSVYRRIFGGNVNLLNGKRRGGNVGLSNGKREYFGAERGYVLRFLNQGTRDRYVGRRNNKANQKWYDEQVASGDRRGFRGHIEPRNWFSNASQAAMERAAEKLDTYIENVIKKLMD